GETGEVAADPAAWGDVIVGRKETPTSYHLAVAIDDALQGVTEVVRGQDLFWSTSVHRLLQALLRLPAPTYHHHRLVPGPAGRKLSNTTQAPALETLRTARALQNGPGGGLASTAAGRRKGSGYPGNGGPALRMPLLPRAGPMAICGP